MVICRLKASERLIKYSILFFFILIKKFEIIFIGITENFKLGKVVFNGKSDSPRKISSFGRILEPCYVYCIIVRITAPNIAVLQSSDLLIGNCPT